MIFFSKWYGVITTLWLLSAGFALFLTADANEANGNRDHLWHDEGMIQWTQGRYFRSRLLAITIFPIGLMAMLQVAFVPVDLAPGMMPSIVDLCARGLVSLGALYITAASIWQFLKLSKKNHSPVSTYLRIALTITLFLLVTFYPWIPRSSPWWRLESFSLIVVFTVAVVLGWYQKRKEI